MMVSSCPVTWSNKYIKQMCENEPSLDTMLTMLPVTDGIDHRIFRNVYCALCNKAQRLEYWKTEMIDNGTVNGSIPFHENLAKINDWTTKEPDNLMKEVRFCIPKFPGCKKDKSLAGLLNMSKENLELVCKSYSFPLCVFETVKFRNLHCMLCAGGDYSEQQLLVNACPDSDYTENAAQTVVFDFKSSFFSCNQGKIFDPFTGECLDPTGTAVPDPKPNVIENGTSNETLPYNCIPTNFTKTHGNQIIVNGSARPDMYLAVVDNSSYICWNVTKMIRCIPENHSNIKRKNQTLIVITLSAPQILIKVINNSLFICRNKTGIERRRRVYGNGTEKSDFGLRVITMIGFAASTVCIILLLATYAIFVELRTTPGKSVMSLTCALVVYMACYIPMTSTSYPILCMVNALVLHFSLLSIFFWFNVLAYDMSKRFGTGRKGKYKL